ncbi:MAG TPA: hypothetical protein VNG89_23570 [Vicinamibacterales bacterium]|nr:hypothetical protein [Vicinamibacterales bacterium]
MTGRFRPAEPTVLDFVAMTRRTARKPVRRKRPKWLTWLLAAGVVGAAAYGLSEVSGVAYNERAIRVVDFSSLTSTQKRAALVEANTARCNCGCGMGLAQCVATDSTCPIREPNIEKIRTMVRDAAR